MCKENRIAKEVVEAVVKLHNRFGSGMYETVSHISGLRVCVSGY